MIERPRQLPVELTASEPVRSFVTFDLTEMDGLLDGRKTRLTLPMIPQPRVTFGARGIADMLQADRTGAYWLPASPSGKVGISDPQVVKSPLGGFGSRVWVKEPYRWKTISESQYNPANPMHRMDKDGVKYLVNYAAGPYAEELVDWHSAETMPRWASRFELELTGIQPQRLQSTSREDVKAEGEPCKACAGNSKIRCSCFVKFKKHWNQRYGTPQPVRDVTGDFVAYRSFPWHDKDLGRAKFNGIDHHIHGNPWVWVYHFKVTTI